MKIRKAAVAGMFYPGQKEKLKKEVDLLLSIAPEEKIEKIFGLIVPHAGYIYSGKTAAYAFNLLKNSEYKKIIILSPSHREYFKGASIYDGDMFETPLGSIPVDSTMAQKISIGSELVYLSQVGHLSEHAIEVELPFLQEIIEDFSIVPIVLGGQKNSYMDVLAERIVDVMDENTIIIASSDLSHYYSKQIADKMDSVFEEHLKDMDVEGLADNFSSRRCEACGESAVLTLLKAAKLKSVNNIKVLNRSDSSDASGDTSQVVGYLSAVLYEN